MKEIVLLTVFLAGVLAQVPNLQQPRGGFVNANANRFGPGTGGVQPGFVQPVANPNRAGGFNTPFGQFGGQTGMPFGRGGIGGQVFGGRGGMQGQGALSPMARMMMSLARNPNNYRYATCTFNDTWTMVRGRADFRQFLIGQGSQEVNIRVQITGLPAAVSEVDRGFHVHEFGDIGDGCARVGPHFNPYNTPHGSQRSFAYMRHVGDLGNIRQTSEGQVSTQFIDQVVSLEGTNSIVGRSLVITYERDDEGLGNMRESKINGNTHNPIACCTIGRTTASNWYNPLTSDDITTMATTGLMPENRIDPMNAANQNMANTNINNPFNQNTGNPNMGNPNMGNQNMGNPNMGNPNMGNPNMGNPNMMNPNVPNTNMGNPNTGFVNPNMQNQNFGNPNMMNPNMVNPNMPNTNMGNPNMNTNTGVPNTNMFNNNMNPAFNRPGTAGAGTAGFGNVGFGAQGFGNPGTSGFGAGTFSPGAAQGQTFNFNNQGKK